MWWLNDGSEMVDWLNTSRLVPFVKSMLATGAIEVLGRWTPANVAAINLWLARPDVKAAVTSVRAPSGCPIVYEQ